MSGATSTLIQLVGVAISSGGIVAIINAVMRRRPIKVDAADRLNETTLEWAEALKADAEAARKDARMAREEAGEAYRQLRHCRLEAEELAHRLRVLRLQILSPNTTREQLAAIIGDVDLGEF